jgi:hypothetical protein
MFSMSFEEQISLCSFLLLWVFCSEVELGHGCPCAARGGAGAWRSRRRDIGQQMCDHVAQTKIVISKNLGWTISHFLLFKELKVLTISENIQVGIG